MSSENRMTLSEATEPMRFMVIFSRLPVLPLARFARFRNLGVQFSIIIIIMRPMIHPALPFFTSSLQNNKKQVILFYKHHHAGGGLFLRGEGGEGSQNPQSCKYNAGGHRGVPRTIISFIQCLPDPPFFRSVKLWVGSEVCNRSSTKISIFGN